MRVMLMVQDVYHHRPACVGVLAKYKDGDKPAKAVRDRVDRWWLVEAESANEARVAIEYARLIPGSAVFESMKDGHKARILASGGRS